MTEEWRRVIAALKNQSARRVYARVVLGETLEKSARLDRDLESLSRAGLIERTPDHGWRDTDAALAELLATPTRPEVAGVERFLTKGRIERLPARASDRLELLAWTAERLLGADEAVTEREINDRLEPLADDVALVRRYLVDEGLLERAKDGSTYSLVASTSSPASV